MNTAKDVRIAIDKIVEGKKSLRELDVIRSERLVGEIGEWLAEKIFGGERAISSSQKGYDLIIDGKKYQIKTHAKGDKNNARWTQFNYSKGEFDYFIIIVMSKEIYLKEVYLIDEETLFNRIDETKKQRVVDWDKYQEFKKTLGQLPNQEVVKEFVKNA